MFFRAGGRGFFIYRKSMKIIQSTLKTEEKISYVPKKFRVGPPKSRVGRVSGLKLLHS